MRQYLGASRVDAETIQIHWDTSPDACLAARSGRASPIYPLSPEAAPPAGAVDALLVFVFPRSARQLLAEIRDDFPRDFVTACYATHGLAACVLMLPATMEHEEVHSRLNRTDIVAYEMWPVRNGLVLHRETLVRYPAAPSTEPIAVHHIPETDLPEPVAQELRQFNANLALLVGITREFVPEYRELCEWLYDSVTRRVTNIRKEIADATTVSPLTPLVHHDVGILVDVNSCMTMVISQSAGVLPPIFNSNYPVGEFSLLGIGSAAKAVWALYQAVASVFSRADHVSRLRDSFSAGPFDPGFNPPNTDYESWTLAGRPFGEARAEDDQPGRKHLIYFSSRWGFHETLNSISLSWQSITSCATRHWNLLTLSHEFLHSHFRELVRTNIFDIQNSEQLAEVCATYNDMWKSGWNGRPQGGQKTQFTYADSFRTFLINQMNWCNQAALYRSGNGASGDSEWLIDPPLTPEIASDLANNYLAEFVEEYVVHIMDFHYFFDGDDQSYLSSLWHSWSLVPFVHKKLNHYLLRSLLALASTNASTDSRYCFSNAWQRLVDFFKDMQQSSAAPIAAKALEALMDDENSVSLYFDFKYSFQLVPFTRRFLIDPELNQKLTFDPLTSDGQQYAFREGEFSSVPLVSPTAFLLDRYEHAHNEKDPADFASLWQLLMLA